MATTTIFNGTLTAAAKGSWVAVPSVTAYTIQISGADAAAVGVEMSLDGVNAIPFNQLPTMISVGGSTPKAYVLNNIPVASMRASNGYTSQSATATIYVQTV